jgi:hypothetical protein
MGMPPLGILHAALSDIGAVKVEERNEVRSREQTPVAVYRAPGYWLEVAWNIADGLTVLVSRQATQPTQAGDWKPVHFVTVPGIEGWTLDQKLSWLDGVPADADGYEAFLAGQVRVLGAMASRP